MTNPIEDGPQIAGSQAKSAKIARSRGRSAGSRRPSGLSAKSGALWDELHEVNDFLPHEDAQLERALVWWDEADRLKQEASKLRGKERAARLKSAGDASTVGLRHWRTLKFADPAHPARRPGRPPGRPRPPEDATVLRFHA